MDERLMTRSEIPEELKWDITLLYKSEKEYNLDIEKLTNLHLQLRQYKGRLNNSSAITECMRLYEQYCVVLHLVMCYAELRLSVDYSDSASLELSSNLSALLSRYNSELSFIDSELSVCETSEIEIACSCNKRSAGYLREILRKRKYQLHPEAERVLSSFTEMLNAPYSFYEQLKLSDIRFDAFYVEGKEYPLDYSLYEDNYEYDTNTSVRRSAFDAFSRTIAGYVNATACAYNTEVRKQKVESDLRGFNSVFDSLLFDQHVTQEMYDRQIDLIMSKLSHHMRRYANIIRRVNKLDRMTYADLKAPIDPTYNESISISNARTMVRGALSILGDDYVQLVDRAFNERWIDFARNKGKSTGGFCETPYGKNSYILMTWNNRISDVFTLAHELGHAGHFDACNNSQSIFDTDVSRYFVEAPSTMNELLLGYSMLSKADNPRLKKRILAALIGDTYFHNMVTHLIEAAFQREVYRIVDAGGSVHAELLNGIMGETLRTFWGDAVEIDKNAEFTWMRQPHYYMGLYSYTYSAGLTIATCVCDRILSEGSIAVDDWKRVLKAGAIEPIRFASEAGIDITTEEPLLKTIDKIGMIIDQIEQLTDEIEI